LFYSFATESKLSIKDLAELIHLHPRTIQNYSERNKAMDPVESEHLLKIIALYMKGEAIFGNIDEFNYWLQKPFWTTKEQQKEKPADLLITPGGVSDELDRLAYGYAV
jgi:uncharacterized protein (DUF2384 family)